MRSKRQNKHAVVVNLNSVNIQDDDVAQSSADAVLSDHMVTSSSDAVQPPQSTVIMAIAEQQQVKSGKVVRENTAVAREKTAAVTAPVKSSNTLKSKKRQSSSSRLREPCSKRLRRGQKFRRETTNAEWTESLFVSEASETDGDVVKNASAVDTEELNATSSTDAASSAITYTPSVSEGGQFETASLKKLPQPDSGTLSLPTTSGQTLIHTDDACCDTIIADGTGECQSDNTSSHLVNTCLSRSSPAIQHTVRTDLDDNIPHSSPSSAVHVVKTTLSPNRVTQSCPNSTSETVFLVPVHTNSVTTSGTPVYQVMTATKMPASTDMQTISVKPGSSPATEHQPSDSTPVPVCSHIHMQSQSSLQSKPSVPSDLLSTCKSVMPPVVLPQNTTGRRSILVHSKQSKPQSNVKFEEPLHSTASGVRLPRPSVSLTAPQRCSGSAIAIQQQTSRVAGYTDSMTIPIRPRVASPHPIRIRISASDLDNTADPAAVMNRVRGILSRTNTILPGAQIRIRYMSPPMTSSQSSVTQTTAGEHVNTTVPQLDGTTDSDDDVKQSEDTSPTSAKNISTVGRRRRRSKAADADDKPVSESCVSTYKSVKLVPRPWKTPEGTVNHMALRTLLSGLMIHIMENPGITRDMMVQKYGKYLQPVPLFELIEMLEDIGCIYCSFIQCCRKPSLFSSRSSIAEVSGNSESETTVYFPSVDCILKLGQFMSQLQSGLRTSS